MAEHIPVLVQETLSLLRPERGGVFVDATLGLGGHSEVLLQAAQQAQVSFRLIAIDQDPEAIAFAKQRLGTEVTYLRGNFSHLLDIRTEGIADSVDGILMDIGVSSYQIDTPERGFSFQSDGPLDMRMDPDNGVTAATIVNSWSEAKLATLFFQYGEERLGKKIARAIAERRKVQPFSTTADLAELVVKQYHPAARHKKPHPATRVFQALRIEVNRELEVLEEGITAAFDLLAPGGILAIITFHSLEDRIVKQRFREAAEHGFTLLTKKPLEASREEQLQNPRSRSAKVRAIQKLP